jgi:hypothetical protein
LRSAGLIAAAAGAVAILSPLLSAGAQGLPPGGWTINVGGGLSEARAVGDRGGRLVMSCATYGGVGQPRYAIRLEGPAHGGKPLKAQLDVGPTHYNLDLMPTAQPNTSAWTAKDIKDQRAYRALAMRIRASKTPVKVKVGPKVTEVFPSQGARQALGAQALQCLT